MLDVTQPAGTGDDTAQWTLVAAVGAQATMVLTATVLAVFKPGGRLPLRRPAGGPAST